jgi:hypothetical protein
MWPSECAGLCSGQLCIQCHRFTRYFLTKSRSLHGLSGEDLVDSLLLWSQEYASLWQQIQRLGGVNAVKATVEQILLTEQLAIQQTADDELERFGQYVVDLFVYYHSSEYVHIRVL